MPCLDGVLRKQLGQPPGDGLLALQPPAGEEQQLGPRRADEPQRALRACTQPMSKGSNILAQRLHVNLALRALLRLPGGYVSLDLQTHEVYILD